MAILVAGKRIKVFKKRHDGEPDLGNIGSDVKQPDAEDEPMGEE